MPAARKMNKALFLINYFIQTLLLQSYANLYKHIYKVYQCITPHNYKKQRMTNNDESQLMLQQIRNLLVNNMNTTREDFDFVTDEKVKQYLSQSFRLVEGETFDKNNSHLIYSKICQASLLLANQSPMIKNYVKDKIQSDFFGAKNSQVNPKQYQKLLQMREHLEKKRLKEKIEQQNSINSMIQSTRKYKKYENKKEIPLLKIESLIQNQKVDYDKLLRQQHRLKSNNNQLKIPKINLKQQSQNNKITRKKSSKKISFRPNQENLMIEVHGQQENQHIFLKKKSQIASNQLQDTLIKSKNFLSIFQSFLEAQARKIQVDKLVSDSQHVNNDSESQPKKRYIFPNKLKNRRFQENSPIQISKMSKIYKFKPFVVTKYEQNQQLEEPIMKIVSKRIGESFKFHMKKCLIEGRTLYYGDQKNSQQLKKQDMKSIEIDLAKLKIMQVKKQEGSIFQSKNSETEVVEMKGKQRTFIYQLNLAQGAQLTKQINKINLKRLHRMSCQIRQSNNKDMGKFIEGDHSTLDLSNKYIRLESEYPDKTFRQIFVAMIIELISNRKSTHILNFSKSRLTFKQINHILKQCEKSFTNISSINMSFTKLDKQTLRNVLILIEKCSPTSTVALNLNYCQLNDDIIEDNISNFKNVCSKLTSIQLQGNQITSVSIKCLKSVLSLKNCQLKSINITGCPIQQFGQLSSMIKTANKLESVYANGCKLTISNSKIIEDLLLATQQKQNLKSIQLRRNGITGSLKWFEEIGPYLQLKVDLPVKSVSSKSLQSKFLRVQFINTK